MSVLIGEAAIGIAGKIATFKKEPFMKDSYISLKVSDGTSMDAYVSGAAGSPKGGIIVLQEAFGVNDYIRGVADRLAAESYMVIAPELFHRSAPGYEAKDAPIEEIMPLIRGLKNEEIEEDVRAARTWLSTQAGIGDRIGIVGFCMGGRSTFIANSVLPFKAAISLYGSGIVDLLDRVPGLSAPMLFFWGGADARNPRESWNKIPAAMDAAGKSHIDVEMSGAEHAYMTHNRRGYHREASELTWPLIVNFFQQKLA